MIKYIIAIAVLWFLYRISTKKDDKVFIKKDTKIDFKKVKDAEFEDNESVSYTHLTLPTSSRV